MNEVKYEEVPTYPGTDSLVNLWRISTVDEKENVKLSLWTKVLWLKQVLDIKFQGSEQQKKFSMGCCGKHSS
jgi:hypothetical protein